MNNPIQVLLVEDDRNTRLLLRDFFKQADGMEICGEARDGMEALELLRVCRPDLMLLDLVMPHMDGIELLKALREEPGLSALKIIVHSGVGSDAYIQQAIRLGAHYYLIKPTKLAELAARVADLFPQAEEKPAEGLVAWTLLRMGARHDMLGFGFLCHAIELLAQDESRQLKEVYLLAARKFDTTYGCVEKNLRTSIRQIHEEKSDTYLTAFGERERPPKNGVFLHRLVGVIKDR